MAQLALFYKQVAHLSKLKLEAAQALMATKLQAERNDAERHTLLLAAKAEAVAVEVAAERAKLIMEIWQRVVEGMVVSVNGVFERHLNDHRKAKRAELATAILSMHTRLMEASGRTSAEANVAFYNLHEGVYEALYKPDCGVE